MKFKEPKELIFEAADGVYFSENENYNYTDEEAYPIILVDDWGISDKNVAGNSHWALEILIEKQIRYNQIRNPSSSIIILGNREAALNKFDDIYEEFGGKGIFELLANRFGSSGEAKGNHCRIWKKSKIFASWDTAESFEENGIKLVEEFIRYFNGNPKKYKYHTYELDSSELVKAAKSTEGIVDAYYTYDEFLKASKGGSKIQIDNKLRELKQQAHVMDGRLKRQILGIKPKPKKRKNYWEESVLSESPDIYGSVAFWDKETIAFITDRQGNSIVSFGGVSHGEIQEALWFNAEENEEELLKLTPDEQIQIINKFSSFKYTGNPDTIIKKIKENVEDYMENHVRYNLDKFAVGRIFKPYNSIGAVSLWNEFEELNSKQKRAIFQILDENGFSYRDVFYEVGGEKEKLMDYKEFKTNPKIKKTIERKIDMTKELHTTVDPKVRRIVMDELGIKPKIKENPFEDYYTRNESFKYYAFDWDENLMHMPTKIIAEDVKGELVEISTRDYTTIKEQIENNKLAVVSENVIKRFPPNAFENFRKGKDFKFLQEIYKAKTGPAWKEFKEAVNNGRIFSIITARGHDPKTLALACEIMIKEGIGGLNYYSCIDSLRELQELYSINKKIKTDDELFESYIYTKCKYYPISYLTDGTNIPLEKANMIKEYKEYVEGMFKKFHPEFHSNVANNFYIGFSDDDEDNLKEIAKESKINIKLQTTRRGLLESFNS